MPRKPKRQEVESNSPQVLPSEENSVATFNQRAALITALDAIHNELDKLHDKSRGSDELMGSEHAYLLNAYTGTLARVIREIKAAGGIAAEEVKQKPTDEIMKELLEQYNFTKKEETNGNESETT